MSSVVIASGNAGKLREISALLEPMGMTVRPQSDFKVSDVAETGLTFIENALIKARHAAHVCPHPVIADDSGIEVPVLNGRPGIYSARYAGTHGDDAANNRKLVDALSDFDGGDRVATFRCVMVYLRHADDPVPIVAEGVWRGVILKAERGTGGFGYDPLFFVPALGKTGAELDPATKNAISHRGQALAALTAKMQSQL